MNEAIKKHETTVQPKNRPILLSILCFFVFTYSGVLIIFFFSSVINAKWITKMLNEYSLNVYYSTTEIFLFSIIGLIFFLILFFGAIKLWFLKKSGFIILSISNFLFIAFQLLTGNFNVILLILCTLIIIIASFYYRFYE